MAKTKQCDIPARPVADAYDDLVNAIFKHPERIIKKAHKEVENGLQYNSPCAQF